MAVDYTNHDLFDISRYLNFFPYLIIISVLAHLFPPGFILSSPLFFLFVFLLAKAAKMTRPLLWGILAIIPLVGLGCSIVLVVKAVRILKKNGVKVGVFGVRKKDRDSLLRKENE